MHVEFLVEEPSMEALLDALLGRRGGNFAYQVRVFQGKHDLLKKLPSRLMAYSRWITDDRRVVVVVDRDQDDCHELKARLEQMALQVGLTTRSHRRADGAFSVVNRIAVEELEAWFLGDPDALRAEFPRLPASLGERAGFRDPDAVAGGTHEALARLLAQHGYYQAGLAKIDLARRMGRRMTWATNRSRSFQVFGSALEELLREVDT